MNESRIKYNDVTFVILAQDAVSLKLNLDYLLKYIDSNFLVIGQDSFESICKTYTLDNIQFVHLDITTGKNVDNVLSGIDFKTDKIGVVSSDSIMPIQQIQQAVEKANNFYKVCPYNKIYKMDVLTSFLFEKLLDCEFLKSNVGKLFPKQDTNSLKCFFINRRKKISTEITAINGYLFLNH